MFQSKFTTPLAIAALGCLIGYGATAHEFIASSKTLPANSKDTAVFILDSTHVFGSPEEAEASKHVAAQLITPSTTTDLDVSENADAPNLTGTFTLSEEEPAWLVGHRLPVIWSQTPDGWKEGGPDVNPDAVASSGFEKFSKNLTGGDGNAAFVSTPLGHTLEIVPLSDPRAASIGDDIDVQVAQPILHGGFLTAAHHHYPVFLIGTQLLQQVHEFIVWPGHQRTVAVIHQGAVVLQEEQA